MRTIPEYLQDNYLALHIPKDITDDEIDTLIRQTLPKVAKSERGCVCGIYGYEFDAREIYEIPEVTVVCKRLVERGFVGMMHPSTTIDKEEKPFLGRLLGGMEVWAIATGRLHSNGDMVITEEDSQVFLVDMEKSTRTAWALAFPQVRDGQHRTSIS